MNSKIKKTTKATAVIAISVFMAVGCKKAPDLTKGKNKQLAQKVWVLDAEATRTWNLTKAGDKTGITNLKDIKLEKDVKAIADFAQAKTLNFGAGSGKDADKLVFAAVYGKSLLSIKNTGYWKWLNNETQLELEEYSNAQKKWLEKVVYDVKELSDNRLVIMNTKSGAAEIYKF